MLDHPCQQWVPGKDSLRGRPAAFHDRDEMKLLSGYVPHIYRDEYYQVSVAAAATHQQPLGAAHAQDIPDPHSASALTLIIIIAIVVTLTQAAKTSRLLCTLVQHRADGIGAIAGQSHISHALCGSLRCLIDDRDNDLAK